MIPYYPEPLLHLGPVTIPAFRITLVAAVLLGGYIMVTRAVRLKAGGQLMFDASRWAVVAGFIGAHAAKVAMDYHADFIANPMMMFSTEGGIRSIGGLAGGLIGMLMFCLLWKRLSFLATFRLLDVMAYSMPFAFAVGRLGCFLVHDHRGIASTSWIAVRFPEGSRYDLGLIECLFLVALSLVFWSLARRERPAGFFLAGYGLVYGVFRIWLDTLHIQPMRFWEGGALAVMGAAAILISAFYSAPARLPATETSQAACT